MDSALVMHNTTQHIKCIYNNLLLNQSVDHVICKLYIVMCFKGTYVVALLWFKYVETDLPSD